jgi:hypothetical protein
MKKVDVTMVAIAIRTARDIADSFSDKLGYDGSDGAYDRGRQASASAKNQLEDFGFTVRDDYRGHAVSFGGVRATCTGGLLGAVQNWLRKAEAKIGDAA